MRQHWHAAPSTNRCPGAVRHVMVLGIERRKIFGDNQDRNHWKRYRELVSQGSCEGRRPELVGGGLIRGLGGWQAVKMIRGKGPRIKGDERILGASDFVAAVLTASQDELEL